MLWTLAAPGRSLEPIRAICARMPARHSRRTQGDASTGGCSGVASLALTLMANEALLREQVRLGRHEIGLCQLHRALTAALTGRVGRLAGVGGRAVMADDADELRVADRDPGAVSDRGGLLVVGQRIGRRAAVTSSAANTVGAVRSRSASTTRTVTWPATRRTTPSCYRRRSSRRRRRPPAGPGAAGTPGPAVHRAATRGEPPPGGAGL